MVRPRGDLYELVVGERRLRAAHMAGLDAIPAVVRDLPDDKMLELALIENIQRADLNAMEKAKAIAQMIAELDLTQEEAGRRLGLERPTIANLLRLLELSEELQQMVSRGTLTAGHARAVLAVEGEAARMRLARLIAAKGSPCARLSAWPPASRAPAARPASMSPPRISPPWRSACPKPSAPASRSSSAPAAAASSCTSATTMISSGSTSR